MGIFDSIRSAIFGSAEAAEPAEAPPVAAPDATPAKSAPVDRATARAAAAPAGPVAAAKAPSESVDVAAILDAAVAKAGQKLDWRHSIVDTMKALGLDSSLAARRELAGELGYDGDTGDTATMNMWLHKTLMQKLADNGGKVPPELMN